MLPYSNTLDPTRLATFGLGANQEHAILSRLARQQSSTDVPPALIRFGFRLTGRVNPQAVEAALAQFVERHPALRTSISEHPLVLRHDRDERLATFKRTQIVTPGSLVQQVHENIRPRLARFEWTSVPLEQREGELRRLLQSEERRSFNDSDTCRLRPIFIQTGSNEALLILVFDHVVFDGFSGSITCREVEALLTGQLEVLDRSSQSALPAGHPGFAQWQQRAFRNSYFRSSIAFWRDQWAQFARYRISFEDLPFSRRDGQESDDTFLTERVELDEAQTLALKSCALQTKTTPFAVCLAALGHVLSECSGRSTVALWSHLLNRVQPGTIGAVGFFINTHLLGIDVSTSVTWSDLIRSVNRVLSAALGHQELPLPFLWMALKCAPRFHGPFVLLDFRSEPRPTTVTGPSGLAVERLALPDPTTPRLSSLGVYVIDRQNTMEIAVTFRRAMFSSPGVLDFLRRLHQTIGNLIVDPEAPMAKRTAKERPPSPSMEEFLLLDSACIPLAE